MAPNGANGDQKDEAPAALLREIRALVEAGKAREARLRAESALNRYGRSVELHCLLSESLVHLGRKERAVAIMLEVCNVFPLSRRARSLYDDLTSGQPLQEAADTTAASVQAFNPDAEAGMSLDDDEDTAIINAVTGPDPGEWLQQKLGSSDSDSTTSVPAVTDEGPPPEEFDPPTRPVGAQASPQPSPPPLRGLAPAGPRRLDSHIETIDADIVSEDSPTIPKLKDKVQQIKRNLQPGMGAPTPRGTLKGGTLPPVQRVKAEIPLLVQHPASDDDTFGTFNSLPSDILDQAEQVAIDRGMIERPQAQGLDSYLAKVIGTTPAAPISAKPKANPDDFDTGPLDRPVKEGQPAGLDLPLKRTSLGHARLELGKPPADDALTPPPSVGAWTNKPAAPAPVRHKDADDQRTRPMVAASDSIPDELLSSMQAPQRQRLRPAPQPGDPDPPRPAPLPQPQQHRHSQPPEPRQPQMPRSVPSPETGMGPGVVLDRGAAEEDPTINMTRQDAEAELAQAASLAQEARLAKAAMEAAATSLAHKDAAAEALAHLERSRRKRFSWPRLLLRSGVAAAAFFAAYLIIWFPFTWEKKLAQRMDEELVAGRKLREGATHTEVFDAIAKFDEAAQLAGSRFEFIDRSLTWYTSSLLGRDTLSARSSSARQEATYTRALAAAHLDPAERGAAEEGLEALSDVHSVLVTVAQALLDEKRGDLVAASAAVSWLEQWGMVSPEASLFLGELELKRGKPEAARAHFERVRVLAPSDLNASIALARSYEHDEPLEAVKLYDELLEAHPDHPTILARRAIVLLSDDPQAEKSLRDLLSAKPSMLSPTQKGEAHLALATFARIAGRADEAEASLRTAIALDDENGRLLATLVDLYLEQGRMESAEEYLRKALKVAPDDPEVRLMQVESLLKAGDMKSAQDLLDELSKQSAPAALRNGVLALEHRDTAKAKQEFVKASSLAGDASLRAWAGQLGGLLADELSLHDRAWASVKMRLLSLSRRDRLAVAWALMARGEQLAVSERIFKEVLDQDPTQASALAGRCAMLGQQGSEQDVLKYCGEAIALAPNYTPTSQAAGMAYLRLERYADAFTAFTTVLRSTSNLAAMRGAVVSALVLWKLDTADTLLDQWLSDFGASGEQYYWLGRTALQKGEVDVAKEYLNRAVESPEAEDSWRPYYAEALLESGSVSKAKDALRGLSDIKGSRAGAQIILSRIALRERHPTAAADHAQKAVTNFQLDGGTVRQHSLALVAVALADAGPDTKSVARLNLNEAIRIDARNVDAYYQLGLLERRQGRIDEARQDFERALAIYPEHKPSRNVLSALQ